LGNGHEGRKKKDNRYFSFHDFMVSFLLIAGAPYQ
jgi:hypothetical protein